MVRPLDRRHHMPMAAIGREFVLLSEGIIAMLEGRFAGAFGLMMMALTPACGGDSVSPDARWKQQVQENESPQQGIDFTWAVRYAPGPFGKVVARAQYDKDGNNYGRAQSRWGLTGVSVVFRATGAGDD